MLLLTSAGFVYGTSKQEDAVQDLSALATNQDGYMVLTELMQGSKPVVIKFYESWCPKCQATESGYEALANKYKNTAHFIKVDISQYNVRGKFKIDSVPTFLIFKKGKNLGKKGRSWNFEEFIEGNLARY